MTSNIVVEEIQVQIFFVLDNHIVENHTSGHDLVEGRKEPPRLIRGEGGSNQQHIRFLLRRGWD
jgi:hypothetical protein